MNRSTLTVEWTLDRQGPRRAEQAQKGPVPRIPRISRQMALAIKFQRMFSSGEIRDYAELAALGHVSRARVSQTMNLLHLAPDIQEEILFLEDRADLNEHGLRSLTAVIEWEQQRRIWRRSATVVPNPAWDGQRRST